MEQPDIEQISQAFHQEFSKFFAYFKELMEKSDIFDEVKGEWHTLFSVLREVEESVKLNINPTEELNWSHLHCLTVELEFCNETFEKLKPKIDKLKEYWLDLAEIVLSSLKVILPIADVPLEINKIRKVLMTIPSEVTSSDHLTSTGIFQPSGGSSDPSSS